MLTNMIIMNEGDRASVDLESRFQLRFLNLPILRSNELAMNFVGIVINHEQPLIVFPKHFSYTEESLTSDAHLLLEVLRKYQNSIGIGIEESFYSNFPLREYLAICQFYNKFGLYTEQEKFTEQGYKGRINWKRTISKSNKVINNNNLVFLPFTIDKKMDQYVFITYCMEEVLNDGYKKFGRYFKMGVNYSVNRQQMNDYQMKNAIKQLKMLTQKHFKDSTLNLIRNLIKYFEWSCSFNGSIHITTTNFELIWEQMLHEHLNKYFVGIKTVDMKHELILNDKSSNDFVFEHKKSYEIVQSEPISKSYKVQFDHYLHDHANNTIYVLDSKYYKDVKSLDYKEFFYSTLLQADNLEEEPVTIYNGLLYPTENVYKTQPHINRREKNNVYISEHYLNIKEIMKKYVR